MKINKDNIKVYVEIIKNKSVKFVEKNKKRLIKLGAVILAVITVGTSIMIVFKMHSTVKINDKPAKVIEVKDKKTGKTNLFLEHVEQLKSGIYDVSALVFGEENMRIEETYGESGKNYVVVQGNFKIKYSIDVTRIRLEYDFDKEKVILKVPKDAVGVSSVELIGDIKEIERYKNWHVKAIDWLEAFNDDEEIKEGAIRQLMRNSKVEAQKYDATEVQEKANKALKELVDTINLNNLKCTIEFVDNTKVINIKK
jgi:hypothetical protein